MEGEGEGEDAESDSGKRKLFKQRPKWIHPDNEVDDRLKLKAAKKEDGDGSTLKFGMNMVISQ